MEDALGVSLFLTILLLSVTDLESEIDAGLSSHEVPRDTVLRWIESATDLPTLAKLYRLTGEGYYRIQPELGKEAECRTVREYLLECIRQDVTDDDEIESRWGASRTLHLWLRQLLETGGCSDEIEKTAHAITELFLSSGKEIRLAIEQGFLEHALESAGLRPYFEDWPKNERLRKTWEAAIAWANDHPHWSWKLHQEFMQRTKDDKT